jgi:hypothetical protein
VGAAVGEGVSVGVAVGEGEGVGVGVAAGLSVSVGVVGTHRTYQAQTDPHILFIIT